jgi:glutamyl-tRNA(Gln) amidotransferase subunit E
MSIDYEKVGALVGIEVHQQLDTRAKLFCNCPTVSREDPPHFTLLRQLRPTQSELGEVDPAALFEFQKGRLNAYEAYDDTVCLVEQDEEPPHVLNPEAVDIGLEVALLLGSQPVDEVQVMRKIVIDGSNTTGFQRTSVVAFGGELKVDGQMVPIQTICLEEDAARKMREETNRVYWRLDRLGVPLIEVATAPVLKTPASAQAAALRIGQVLRMTGKVKRGLGTIRQDVNVSIKGGAIIEIKGVQKLSLVARVFEYEVQRQLALLEIREELRRRGIKARQIKADIQDLSALFQQCASKVIQAALGRKEGIFALVLPGFAGLVGREIQPDRRLGSELADYARFWGGVKGLFHTDELPKYGITAEEVKSLRSHLKVDDQAAVVLVAATKEEAEAALKAVVDRAREALVGVPPETRGPQADGTTTYARPRPGAARMYPETDVAPAPVTSERLGRIREHLPELPESKLGKFKTQLQLSDELARGMIASLRVDLFERIATRHPDLAVIAASTLESTWRSLERDGVQVDEIPEPLIVGLFDQLAEGRFAKEAIPDLFTWLAKHPQHPLDEAVQALGLGSLPRENLVALVDEIVAANHALVAERQERAAAPLMGLVMKQVRGRADGKLVSELLEAAIRKQLAGK